MGCERIAPLEALTDYLLALRALLEPEGPASGRLAQRLAVICAPPEDRPALAERIARAIELERAVITGMRLRAGRAGWAGSTRSSTSSPSTCGRSCATCSAATSTPISAPSPTSCSAEAATAPAR